MVKFWKQPSVHRHVWMQIKRRKQGSLRRKKKQPLEGATPSGNVCNDIWDCNQPDAFKTCQSKQGNNKSTLQTIDLPWTRPSQTQEDRSLQSRVSLFQWPLQSTDPPNTVSHHPTCCQTHPLPKNTCKLVGWSVQINVSVKSYLLAIICDTANR